MIEIPPNYGEPTPVKPKARKCQRCDQHVTVQSDARPTMGRCLGCGTDYVVQAGDVLVDLASQPPSKKTTSDTLAGLSKSSRRALEVLASSPSDAAEFHARLSWLQGALRIGTEIMANEAAKERVEGRAKALQAAAAQALATCTAIELTMGVVQGLFPDHTGVMDQKSVDKPPIDFPRNGVRKLDLE